MKVILYNAISIDGYIAMPDGNSDWVTEKDANFVKTIQDAGCVVVGGRTFRQFEGDFYPMQGVLNIVRTRTVPEFQKYDNTLFTNGSPLEILKLAESSKYSRVVVLGGGEVSSAFLRENLIDEIIVDIHPIVMGDGIKLCNLDADLRIFSRHSVVNLADGVVQIVYKKH